MKKNNLFTASAIWNKYFYMYSDCRITKGISKSIITDISRKKIYHVDNNYCQLLIELRECKVGEVLESLYSERDRILFLKFIQNLYEEELGEIVDDITLFPDIEEVWDNPSEITNSIIDIRNLMHDFHDIFRQLDDLGCEFIQIRVFEKLSAVQIIDIVEKSLNLNFRYLNLLVPFPFDGNYMKELYKLLHKHTFLHIYVYNSPLTHIKTSDRISNRIRNRISFLNQNITSSTDCGIINKCSLVIFPIKLYMENLIYNGCLNRKICIDEFGYIKNCPSMSTNYGKVEEQRLKDIVYRESFRKYWKINKSQISVCQDCEYRNLCSDCRAFIVDNTDILSKPLKCSYDPYNCRWH